MFWSTKTSKGNISKLTFSLKKQGEAGSLPYLAVSLKKELPTPTCFGDTNVCGLTIVENARIYSPPGEYWPWLCFTAYLPLGSINHHVHLNGSQYLLIIILTFPEQLVFPSNKILHKLNNQERFLCDQTFSLPALLLSLRNVKQHPFNAPHGAGFLLQAAFRAHTEPQEKPRDIWGLSSGQQCKTNAASFGPARGQAFILARY